MPSITITGSQFEAAIRRQLEIDTEVVRKAALEATKWGERRAVRITNEVGAVDQGAFKLGWTTAVGISDKAAELRNDTPYAGIIERGRRPGRPGPPLAPIFAWVSRKLVGNIRQKYRFAKRAAKAEGDAFAGPLSPRAYRARRAENRRRIRDQFGSEQNGVTAGIWGAAMNIRDAIHARGTKPRWILRRTYAEMKPIFKAEAMRRLRSNKR